MQKLGLAFSLALVAVNLWGVMLAAGLYWRNRWFALVAGPIIGITLVYAIECQHGLGRSLALLGFLSTVLSLGMIAFSLGPWIPFAPGSRRAELLREWRLEFSPRSLRAPAAVFAGIFLYAFAWRFISPDIDASSEKIADLSYICSYLTGATIPVPDAWYYPFPSTQYYSFQYYGAALLGRLFLLSPGATYNIGYCVLVALCGSAFAGAVFLSARRTWVRVLVLLTFLIGGSGVTIVTHLTTRDVLPWSNMRFIGAAKMDRAPLGPWLKKYQDDFFAHEMKDLANADRHLELPGEIFSYILYLGDFHPPFSGYYLMGIAALGMLLWERSGLRRYAMIVGGTLTWTLVSNTWVLPLQGLGIVAWLIARRREAGRLLPALALGAALVWLATWVYLAQFIGAATGYNVSLKLVPWALHTPPLLFLLFMLPTIALIVLGLGSGERRGRWLGVFWLGLLLFTEFFYVKDVYSGMFERFNTTLKWWPWVTAGTLMTLGPVVLDQPRRRWVRVVGMLFCIYPCFFVFDLWRPFREQLHRTDGAIGQIDGTNFLIHDEFPRLLLGRLTLEKPGVVIERPEEKGGFVNAAVLPLFARQRMWLGWFGHELLWHGYSQDIRHRHDQLTQFYNGDMADSGMWLLGQGIDYILWYRPGDTPELWAKLNSRVQPQYMWTDILTYPESGNRVGFWRRRASAP